MRHYADTHGFATHIETEFSIDRPPAWRRIKLIEELFDQGYEWVLWMDADAVVVRFDCNILDEMPAHADLGMVRIDVPAKNWREFPITGLLLLRNCAWSRQLLADLWAMEKYVHHPLWENAALLDLMGVGDLLNLGPRNPNQALLAHVHWLDPAWNQVPECGPVSDAPIVVHYAGMSAERRKRDLPRIALEAAYKAARDAGS